ncbi:MAG TPA: roadblock/LC7 domain-containing protein [Vicinamibacteria bacterium]|nr:roadblock/LC7 domain-containing protein [Vicinamibacteria bacterium]
MAHPSAGELTDALTNLLHAARGLSAAFLATVEGRFLASAGLSGVEQVRLGAIAAATLATASKGAQERHLGALQRVHIVGEAGSILLLQVGPRAILALALAQDANLDAVLGEAGRATPRLEGLI